MNRTKLSSTWLLAILICLGLSNTSQAQDDDLEVGRWLFFGGITAGDFEEPEPIERSSRDRVFAKLRLGARYQRPFAPGWLFDGDARLSVQYRDPESSISKTDVFLEINRLFVHHDSLFESPYLSLDAGRTRLQDTRSWLYDATMELAQINYESTLIQSRIGVASWLWDGRFGVGTSSFFDDDDRVATGSDYFFAEWEYQWRYQHHVGVKWVHENYKLPNELGSRISDPDDLTLSSDLDWLALNVRGQHSFGQHSLEYWLDLGLVDGSRELVIIGQDSRPDLFLDQKLDGGIGWDLRLVARLFDNKFALGLGYAGGEGDRQLGSDSGSYTQTQAASNKGKVAGQRRYHFYGEVLGPRLTNINIFSLWAGYGLTERLWVEAAYHDYEQDHAQSILYSNRTIFLPNGLSTDLGSGFDIVFGGRVGEQTELMLITGLFSGGDAFDNVTVDPDGYRITAQVNVRW